MIAGYRLGNFSTSNTALTDPWVADVGDYLRDQVRAGVSGAMRDNDNLGRLAQAARAQLPALTTAFGDQLRAYLHDHRGDLQAEVAHLDVAAAVPTRYKVIAGIVGAAALAGAVFGFLAWRRGRRGRAT